LKVHAIVVFASLLVLLAGCVQPPIGEQDAHGCDISAGYAWCDALQKCIGPSEGNCTAAMTMDDAKAIAQASSGCMAVGNLTPDYTHNDVTKTWWFDLDTVKPGCAPACVVYEDNGTADVNWRCTGLVPPAPENETPMPGSDRDEHGCIPSAGYSWCEAKQKCYRPWEESCMNLSEAVSIAQASECAKSGNLASTSSYNNNSDTWWIDLDTVKQGCAPACVVYAGNKTAEVNWRCTGLLPEKRPVLKTYQHPTLGEILTNYNNRTLYVFVKDSVGTPTCVGSCSSNWPPLVLTSVYTTDVTGLPGTIGTVKRIDDLVQVTYNGMPLYTYAYDSQPGDALGEGANRMWYAVTANMTTFPPAPAGSIGTKYY